MTFNAKLLTATAAALIGAIALTGCNEAPAPAPAAAPGKEDTGKAADEGKKPGAAPAPAAAAPGKEDKGKAADEGKKPILS